MQTKKTNLNSLVDQCLASLKLEASPPPPLEEEKEKKSSSSYILPPYPSFMDYPISQEYNSNGDHGHNLLLSTKRREKTKREFPPPISFLAGTENVPSHMPWVLMRYYTDDGRLILREERVKHYEYFEAHRSGGRVTLQLFHMDEDDDGWVEERHCSDEEAVVRGETIASEEEGVEENNKEGVEVNGISDEEDISGGGGGASSSSSSSSLEGGSKCLSYIPVRGSSTCIFGVPVPALRPVHS